MTEFTVAIQRPAVEDKIRLGQVSKWAESNTRGSRGCCEKATRAEPIR